MDFLKVMEWVASVLGCNLWRIPTSLKHNILSEAMTICNSKDPTPMRRAEMSNELRIVARKLWDDYVRQRTFQPRQIYDSLHNTPQPHYGRLLLLLEKHRWEHALGVRRDSHSSGLLWGNNIPDIFHVSEDTEEALQALDAGLQCIGITLETNFVNIEEGKASNVGGIGYRQQVSERLRARNQWSHLLNISDTGGSLTKVRRGVTGYVNDMPVSALADTGSPRNIVSQAFAQDMNFKVEGPSSDFYLGNSRHIQSLGMVTLRWAFSEKPEDPMEIVCDVLPSCAYSIILGNQFLAATETLSTYKSRLTECLFSATNVLQMNLLGDDYQRLLGQIGDHESECYVSAMPDTGAEGNIMDYGFAVANNFKIHPGRRRCSTIQFADGSQQDTIGQVETYWTFESGKRIPVTFEVLENCCVDVVLGEPILYEHNVYQDHSSSLITLGVQDDAHQLAPFDFANRWQRCYNRLSERLTALGKRHSVAGPTGAPMHDTEEYRRQEAWEHKYSFGDTATEAERAAEVQRRRDHESAIQDQRSTALAEAQRRREQDLTSRNQRAARAAKAQRRRDHDLAMQAQPPTPTGAAPRRQQAFLVPSIATAPSCRQLS